MIDDSDLKYAKELLEEILEITQGPKYAEEIDRYARQIRKMTYKELFTVYDI